MNFKSEKGFTLTELLVTMAIMAVLFGLISASYTGYQNNTQNNQAKNNLERVSQSANRFLINYNAATDSLVPGGVQTSQLITGVAQPDTPIKVSEKTTISSVLSGSTPSSPDLVYLITDSTESIPLERKYVFAVKSQSGDVFSQTVSREGVLPPVKR